MAKWIGLLHVHRAKFQQVKRQIIGAEPLLPEEHRTSTVQFNAQRNHKHERKRDEQTNACNHHVLDAFDDNGYLVERLAHHTKGANVAVTTTVQHLEILVPCGGKNPERNGEWVEAPR